MAGNIQPPDPERFKWERHTSVIEPQGFRLKVRGVLDRDNKADALGHLGRRWASSSLSGTETVFGEDASANQSFWRVIATAAEDPVPPLPVPSTIRRQQVRGGEIGYATSRVHSSKPEIKADIFKSPGVFMWKTV